MILYKRIQAYIDCEWGSDNKTLSLQVLLRYGKSGLARYIVFHEDLKEFLKSKNYSEGLLQGMNARLLFSDFSPSKDVLTELIYSHLKRIELPLEKEGIKCDLYMFFSPKDLTIAIGKTSFLDLITQKTRGGYRIEQKRTLRGSFSQVLENGFKIDYKIKDVAGWTNKGLKHLADSLSVPTVEKSLLDDYKSRMEDGLVHCTDDFIKYALNDVDLLERIVRSKVRMVNWLCKDIFSLNKSYNLSTIPMSQGSLVSDVFITYLYSLLDKSVKYSAVDRERVLTAAFCKLGLLKKDASRFEVIFFLLK